MKRGSTNKADRALLHHNARVLANQIVRYISLML